jgi:hypothetical protein
VGSAVVLATGNESAIVETDLEAFVNAVGSTRRLWIVNTRTPNTFCQENNKIFDHVASTHSNVFVIDWFGTSEARGEYLESDGIHLSKDGVIAYTNLIISSVDTTRLGEASAEAAAAAAAEAEAAATEGETAGEADQEGLAYGTTTDEATTDEGSTSGEATGESSTATTTSEEASDGTTSTDSDSTDYSSDGSDYSDSGDYGLDSTDYGTDDTSYEYTNDDGSSYEYTYDDSGYGYDEYSDYSEYDEYAA